MFRQAMKKAGMKETPANYVLAILLVISTAIVFIIWEPFKLIINFTVWVFKGIIKILGRLIHPIFEVLGDILSD
jgi:hypothetical protein